MINRTAVKRKGGGGGGGVPFWPDRYETPGVLDVSTFGLDTKSGPPAVNFGPAYDHSWAWLCGPGPAYIWLAISYIFTRLPPN